MSTFTLNQPAAESTAQAADYVAQDLLHVVLQDVDPVDPVVQGEQSNWAWEPQQASSQEQVAADNQIQPREYMRSTTSKLYYK